jgi:hypothetical protein
MCEQMKEVMEYIQQKGTREDVKKIAQVVICSFGCNMLHLNQACHFFCMDMDE